MHPLLRQIAHRPWPLPNRPWVARQSWGDLLFAHYRVAASVLTAYVPPPLKLQEHGGFSWLGIVPFRMSGVMVRGMPAVPWLSTFPEVNVRLYVQHQQRPGVYFLSLDATNPVAVWVGRHFFHLPYRQARIEVERSKVLNVSGAPGDLVEYRYLSELRASPRRARLIAQYRPVSPVYSAEPGTLLHFLTERYCLYLMAPSGRLYRTDVHHLPWPLQDAEANVDAVDLMLSHGIELTSPPELLHFAKQMAVVNREPELVE